MSGELENTGRILIYQNEKGDTKIDVYFEEDTIWMTQRSMAELYQVTPQNITTHIKHIYEDGELDQGATCKSYLQVQMEGNRQIRRDTKFYNLDMILAVGYRVRSNVGLTSFKGVKVRRSDVTVAKNYMTHEEISTLNLIVNMYLDYAELQAKGHYPMHMADWESKLGDFLRFNGREVLENFGTVKREVAEKLALEQYDQYDSHRRALEAADDVDELAADVKRLKP